MSQPRDFFEDEAMYPITVRVPRSRASVPPLALFVALACMPGGTALGASPPATSTQVTVVAVQGEVSASGQNGHHALHKGDVVGLPATLDTGPDGSLELAQGKTTVSAAPNTELTIAAPLVAGEAIDRIVQSHGNAFYSVAKRQVRKLHVETAYLVAVIKGTQFSVVAQDDSSTISLFEGRLEVRATDFSDVVDLEAGEIAIRHAGDAAIRMLHMDSGEPVARAGDPQQLLDGTTAGATAPAGAPAPLGLGTAPSTVGGIVTGETHGLGAAASGASNLATPAPLPMSAEAAINAAGTSLAAGASLGNGSATVTGGLTTSVAGLNAGAGASLSLSTTSGSANLGTSVVATVGGTGAAAGLAAAAGPSGLSAAGSATASTPLASTTAGLTASAAPSGLSTGATTTLSSPLVSASTAVGAATGAGGTTLGASTSISTPVSAAPVSLSAQVSSASLGLSVATPVATLNLGSGSTTSSTTTTTTTTTTGSGSTSTPTTSNPVGALLGNPTSPIKTLLGH
jgi:hypothetical protein